MTGFGRGSATRNGNMVTVEISSVNGRKGLDLRFTTPRGLARVEPGLAKRIRAAVARGSLNVTVTYELDAEQRRNRIRVDRDLAAHVAKELAAVAQECGIGDELAVRDLLLVPGVVAEEAAALPDELNGLAEDAVDAALAELHQERAREGETLQRDLQARQTQLNKLLGQIREQADGVLLAWQRRLRERIEMLGVELDVDDERLAKEAAFYAERSDITEEVVRLGSHLDRLTALLTDTEPVGRALEFLCQEMSREISTVGAKASDAGVSEAALTFKGELGKVREQIQNVE